MYAETGLLFPPYFQSFSQEVQSFEELCGIQKSNESLSNLIPTSTFLEYDLGEGDLFKAPEPIIEEPDMGFDPVSSAISMISCGEDVISQEAINVTDMGSMQNDSLLNEVFYECKKDLMTNPATKDSFPEITPTAPRRTEDLNLEKNSEVPQGSMYKSVSSGCLSSMEWISSSAARPTFLDFQGVDFAYRMRRAYSEGDMQLDTDGGKISSVEKEKENVDPCILSELFHLHIPVEGIFQTLSNGNINVIHSPFEKTLSCGNYAIEERLQKLTRYRKKKTKRNFGRTIKYACRKALADSQPRVRGRFAKTEESEIIKK